ncbi:UNVERIFIED_CONTAM: hypothetical protein O8I53_11610 [Campylobacter lari]
MDGIYLSNSNDNDIFGHSAIYYKKVYYINGKPNVINGLGEYESLSDFSILKLRSDI